MAVINRAKIRFRERAELLDFLLEVAGATSETLNLKDLLENVAQMVTRIIPAELVAILLYSERDRGLRIRYSLGYRLDLLKNLVIPLNEGITGIAAATGQPQLVNDVRSNPNYLSALDAVRSELAVPILARGKLVGVIDLQSTQADTFTPYDRSMIQLIAARVGASIHNARLFRKVKRQNRLLKTLSQASQQIGSILDLDELLRRIASILHELVEYDGFSVLLVDAQQRTLRNRFSIRYDKRVELDNVPLGLGITSAAVEARKPILVADTVSEPRYLASHPGILSEVAVPLIVHDRVIGVLDLESERLRSFTEDHARMLSLFAPHIASAVENARLYEELAAREKRMEQDLLAARTLQKVLLPRKAPDVTGLEMALGTRAAREITGDIYDFFMRDDGKLLLCFGDSSGKGAAAALYGAMVSGVLRSFAGQEKEPAELMVEMNDILLERKVEAKYATLSLALWDPARKALTISNAGALPPMICRGNGILSPELCGTPVGLLMDREYEQTELRLQQGDLVLFYSDGIPDQLRTGAGESQDYGTQRLSDVLTKSCGLALNDIINRIFADVDEFANGTATTDDQTLLVMQVR